MNRLNRSLQRARRLLATSAGVALIAGALVALTPMAAGATDVTPTGLIQFKFQDGSFIYINQGLSTQQFFDLGPGADIPACRDGNENNDLPPLGQVGSGGGTDVLKDFYPTDLSRDVAAGTGTGGSTTTIIDST